LGEARPIRKQVFLPVPENRVFRSRDSRNTPPKKETGFLKTFFTGDGSNRTDALIFIVFLSLFFYPGQFFFNRRGLIFFREERATGIFSQPLTHPPTCLPSPRPLPPPLPLSSYGEERGGGESRSSRGWPGGVHQCGPGRRTPHHYFSTRTAAAAASRNT
jgi:hypothetical protein